MTTAVVMEPSNRIVRFLRNTLVDYNVENRTGQWIFPDFPREVPTSVNRFPMITVTLLSESSDDMGMFDPDTWDNMTFQIDVFCKDKQALTVRDSSEVITVDKTTYPANRVITMTVRANSYL